MTFVPHLTFDGDGVAALRFYAELFGGEIEELQLYADTPLASRFPDHGDRLAHGALRVMDRRLLAADALLTPYNKAQGVYVQMEYDDLARAKADFDALALGGEIVMAWGAPDWAAGFGITRDRFGTPWIVNCKG